MVGDRQKFQTEKFDIKRGKSVQNKQEIPKEHLGTELLGTKYKPRPPSEVTRCQSYAICPIVSLNRTDLGIFPLLYRKNH